MAGLISPETPSSGFRDGHGSLPAHVVIPVFVIVQSICFHFINHCLPSPLSNPQVVDGTPSWLLTVFPSA